MFYDILGWAAVFVVALAVLTYGSAYLADVTGYFRTLFVRQPYRQIFRAVRWLLAAIVAALSLLTIAE